MVNFLTLFLGLVLGVQDVALQAADPVSRIELFLDGHSILVLEHPPWQGRIDLGRELLPHELVAVGYGQGGEELARTTQWINLPRPPAEVQLLLERDDSGVARQARVSWESLVDDAPSAVEATFDGAALEVVDARLVALPPHDPETLHLLRVELEFGGLVRAAAEITFGGTYLDRVNSELTAIPVRVQRPRQTLRPETMQDWFVARDRPLRVAAIEKGPVDLLIVRDQAAWARLRQIHFDALDDRAFSNPGVRQGRVSRRQWFEPAEAGWERWGFIFLSPSSNRRLVGENPYDLFTHSQKYGGQTGSLHGWLTTLEPPVRDGGHQRLADAVAVAGVTAASGNRRRAVLLVVGHGSQDSSEATPETVRRYLQALGVPLFVWTPDTNAPRRSPWGESVLVSTPSLMARATREIFDQVERQRIVWFEGRYLPQQVTATGRARRALPLAQSNQAGEDRGR